MRSLRHVCLLLTAGCLACSAQWQWPEVRTERQGNSETKVTRNINGREVPVETTEERVLEFSPGRRVVERITRRFTPEGRPGIEDRERIEITRNAGTREERMVRTVVRTDGVSSRGQLIERATGVTTPTANGSQTVVRTERPTLNDRMELAEVQQTERRESPSGADQTTTISSADANGRFVPVARTVESVRTTPEGATTLSSAKYADSGSGMTLVREEVRRTIKGSARMEVDIYEPALPGKTTTGQPKLTRHEIVDRTSVPGGVMEDVRVQLADPEGRLGPPRPAERRTCSGDCGSPAAQ